jgi:hypothetical protein
MAKFGKGACNFYRILAKFSQRFVENYLTPATSGRTAAKISLRKPNLAAAWQKLALAKPNLAAAILERVSSLWTVYAGTKKLACPVTHQAGSVSISTHVYSDITYLGARPVPFYQFTGYLKMWNTFTIKGWNYTVPSPVPPVPQIG